MEVLIKKIDTNMYRSVPRRRRDVGNKSLESVNVGVLKGKIKEIKIKNKIEKVRNYLFTCTRDRTNLSAYSALYCHLHARQQNNLFDCFIAVLMSVKVLLTQW